MNKRKYNMTTTHSTNNRNKKRPVLKLENAPVINTLKDLIEIGKTLRFYKNLDTVMLWKINPYLEQLDEMIGMKSLKETIFYQIIYYLKGMHERNKNNEYLHTMILGGPGMGKTCVSKIIAKIYQTMGILSKSSVFKVAYRDDFIAEYLGQTAIKTRNLLKSCLGGVLFVDEVYSLGPGQHNKDSFSKEAMETLTAFLSEHKNDFCFIGAGYEEDVKRCFFQGNKGLERRFQWIHKIDKYSPEELTEILLKMIKEIKWQLGCDKENIISIIKENKDLFKHAGGDIELLLSKAKITHSKRVFSLDPEHMYILTKKDIENSIEMMKNNRLDEEEDLSKLTMYT
jgi:stage V sporulation protein K